MMPNERVDQLGIKRQQGDESQQSKEKVMLMSGHVDAPHHHQMDYRHRYTYWYYWYYW